MKLQLYGLTLWIACEQQTYFRSSLPFLLRLTSGDTTMTMFFSRDGSTWEYTTGKAWNTTDFPKPVGRFTKTSPLDSMISRKAFSWCLFSLSNPKTSHTFLNASSAIFSHALARDPRKISRVTSWNMQGELWLVTNIWRHGNFISARFRRRFFSAGETRNLSRKNRMLSQATLWTAQKLYPESKLSVLE